MRDISLTITVKEQPDGRAGVVLGYPENQERLSVSDMARILASGISLCVKLAPEDGTVKDYELMQEVIDYLNNEFISLESFSDATLIKSDKGE